jgi:hypothetical protein
MVLSEAIAGNRSQLGVKTKPAVSAACAVWYVKPAVLRCSSMYDVCNVRMSVTSIQGGTASAAGSEEAN